MSSLAALCVLAALLLSGCEGLEVRPFTRIEYMENAWIPRDKEEDVFRSQSLFLTAGPSISYSSETIDEDGEAWDRTWWNANLGVSAQMAATKGRWREYEPGTAITPDVMFWIDEDMTQFVHFSMDFSFFETGHSVFGFLAWEKTW